MEMCSQPSENHFPLVVSMITVKNILILRKEVTKVLETVYAFSSSTLKISTDHDHELDEVLFRAVAEYVSVAKSLSSVGETQKKQILLHLAQRIFVSDTALPGWIYKIVISGISNDDITV
jgi:hypothetical protein